MPVFVVKAASFCFIKQYFKRVTDDRWIVYFVQYIVRNVHMNDERLYVHIYEHKNIVSFLFEQDFFIILSKTRKIRNDNTVCISNGIRSLSGVLNNENNRRKANKIENTKLIELLSM